MVAALVHAYEATELAVLLAALESGSPPSEEEWAAARALVAGLSKT
ncbi:MAG: hypothetical protein KJ548_11890 [Actinobacteria bacterium]|nr:hypothetical protein [Actinomycetota bacterium]MCG2800177.1 hypothetical protein [Cellulomonas sp.]